MIHIAELYCFEVSMFPECKEECELFKKTGEKACDVVHIKEHWNGSNPCSTCGCHTKMIHRIDGNKEVEPCNC